MQTTARNLTASVGGHKAQSVPSNIRSVGDGARVFEVSEVFRLVLAHRVRSISRNIRSVVDGAQVFEVSEVFLVNVFEVSTDFKSFAWRQDNEIACESVNGMHRACVLLQHASGST